jgi:hypothetical protein
MATRTHRPSSQALRSIACEVAWAIRFVLNALARAGVRQPELVPIRVERDSRFR